MKCATREQGRPFKAVAREGMLYDCLLAPDQLASARTMGMTIDHRQQEKFTQELPSVISEMLSLQLMPSLNAKEVCVVDVSVLLPRDETECRPSKVPGDSGSDATSK